MSVYTHTLLATIENGKMRRAHYPNKAYYAKYLLGAVKVFLLKISKDYLYPNGEGKFLMV